MKHTAVLVLGCVAVALVVACGGTSQPAPAPTLDVEATVQARLKKERVIEATVEAKAQASGPGQ